ncbi:MAG: type VI secretion system-associated FHA domain protein TagH, partial [Vicinamibacterales bacterium]
WVLTHNKVSARHALISFRNGIFYIQDTSRNGVSINSPDNRLVRDRPYALKTGDCIFIEPYEIEVLIDAGSNRPAGQPLDADDPFAPVPESPVGSRDHVLPSHGSGEVDPLKFFDPLIGPRPARRQEAVVSSADHLLNAHYDPPDARPDPDAATSDTPAIPVEYDPLAPDDSVAGPIPQHRSRPAADPGPRRPKPKTVAPREPATPPPVAPVRAAPDPVHSPAPPAPRAVASAPSEEPGSRDIAEVLKGAGLKGDVVTPDLARSLGQILRVVVDGLMDVLQARQSIKAEFRMAQTVVRPRDNNPLKFSANVDDALHNLLVKRNPAYLGPVDAFADAFSDLRHHQLAMLAGMRVAFETLLDQFNPDRLQEEFDRQVAKGSLPLMPAKLRYWDLFREKRREIEKDPEAAFAGLFREEFARAYEEQFRTLKAQGRGRAAEPTDNVPPRE